jgi:NAD(P)H-hydrate epimerase
MGAGLVQVAVPRDILPHALAITPELIGLPLGAGQSAARALVRAAESADAIAIGPGMGTDRFALGVLRPLIRLDKPIVVDADALNLLAAMPKWPSTFPAPAVLTPHPGEMRRLLGLLGHGRGRGHRRGSDVPADDRGRLGVTIAASRRSGQVLVLKGHRTVVADAKRGLYYVNRTGNSALSKAGSGDVLSGVLAALLGQKMQRFEAACAAVCIHGLAGEIAGQRLGLRSVLARDVIDSLPAAIAAYEASAGNEASAEDCSDDAAATP